MDHTSDADAYGMFRQLFHDYTTHEVGAYFCREGYWSSHYTPDSAAARVRACCNADKAEYWKLSELLSWAIDADREHILAYFVCDALGFERPVRREDPKVIELRERERRLQAELSACRGELAEYVEQSHKPVQAARFERDGALAAGRQG